MNRAQQDSSRKLDAAMAEFLIAHGWEPVGRRWRHRRLNNGSVLCTLTDAWLQTRATPALGWP